MKFNKTGIVLLTFVLGLTLCGCADYTLSDSNMINTSVADDPMNTPISGVTAIEVGKEPISFAYSFGFGEDYFKIENGKLIISPALTGDDKTSVNVGLKVFIDGIPQYYTNGAALSSTDMMRINTVVGIKNIYELTVDAAIDPELTQHTISAASLAYPDYYPKDNASFGNYHKMLSSVTSNLPIEDAAFSPAQSIKILELENSVMSQEQKESFGLNDANGVMDIELNQNGSGTYKIKNNSLTLSFDAFSTAAAVIPYRVSFYKNHEQVKFNDGYDYIDLSLEGGKMSQAEIKISDVKSGDFIYCIAVPLINRELPLKSRSTIALDDGSGSPSENDTDIITSNPSENISSNGSENSHSTVTESKPNSEVSEVSFQNPMPAFSIGDTLYYTDYDGKMKIYSTQNGTDIVDQTSFDFENGRFFVHGNCISCYTVVGEDFYAHLYDKNLNLVRSVKLNDVLPENLWEINGTNCIDFDENRIVFAYWDNGASPHYELRSCDWDLQNVKTVFSLPKNENDPTASIAAVRLCDDYAAFWVNGFSNGKATQSYGISDFSGNYKIERKDGVYLPQTNGNVALWSDQHVDIGALPSGSVVVAENGEFSSFKTDEQSESQFAFLCGDSILTLNGNGNILRIYDTIGRKTAQITIESGYTGSEAIMVGNKVYVSASGKSRAILVYEVN
ncbi:MAG: hypothetical protein NC299_10935 [Lachnospiraceae bacterium]|nr:hypothetical protein [Lachnospiraceae bacterium]